MLLRPGSAWFCAQLMDRPTMGDIYRQRALVPSKAGTRSSRHSTPPHPTPPRLTSPFSFQCPRGRLVGYEQQQVPVGTRIALRAKGLEGYRFPSAPARSCWHPCDATADMGRVWRGICDTRRGTRH